MKWHFLLIDQNIICYLLSPGVGQLQEALWLPWVGGHAGIITSGLGHMSWISRMGQASQISSGVKLLTVQ